MQRIIWLTQPGMEPFASAQLHALQLAMQEAGHEVQVQRYQPRLGSLRTDRCDWLIWTFIPTQLDVWAAKLYAHQQMVVAHELDERTRHYPAVDLWCVPSAALGKQLIHSGIAAERVEVVTGYAPVAGAALPNLRESLRADDDTLLMYVGGPLTPATGNRLAIWSLLLLQQVEAPLRLVLHGTGPEQDNLLQYNAGLTSQDAVFFASAQASVHELVAQCDIVCLPRTCDGVADALWAGLLQRKPIVASLQPSHEEWLRDGETGLIVPNPHPPTWASTLRRLVDDRSLLTRLSQSPRQLPPTRVQLPEVFLQRKYAMAA